MEEGKYAKDPVRLPRHESYELFALAPDSTGVAHHLNPAAHLAAFVGIEDVKRLWRLTV